MGVFLVVLRLLFHALHVAFMLIHSHVMQLVIFCSISGGNLLIQKFL